jgi:hypothetical protein
MSFELARLWRPLLTATVLAGTAPAQSGRVDRDSDTSFPPHIEETGEPPPQLWRGASSLPPLLRHRRDGEVAAPRASDSNPDRLAGEVNLSPGYRRRVAGAEGADVFDFRALNLKCAGELPGPTVPR